MCGIWGIINSLEKSKNHTRIRSRGPDDVKIINTANMSLIFYRLRIHGLTSGDQPFIMHKGDKTYYLLCNGEIYNYEYLKSFYGLKCDSESDCEVILHLFILFEEDMTLLYSTLDGEFAMAIIVEENGILVCNLARDAYGVRPLFWGRNNETLYFSSLLAGLSGICNAEQFPPGHVYSDGLLQRIHNPNYKRGIFIDDQIDNIHLQIVNRLKFAVLKRLHSDRPICFLNSGGLDSALVIGIASKFGNIEINTFTIGMIGGTDLKFANIVAKHCKTKQTDVIVTMDKALKTLDKIVEITESYDITTNRASTFQYMLSKFLSKKTHFKVVLNGDGADEIEMGYKYFKLAPNAEMARISSEKLLREIHLFDGLRVDRTISSCGLEARLPFLDPVFADYYMGLLSHFKAPNGKQEKWLIREAFNTILPDLLPREILFRDKEAFSDGVSHNEDSWYSMALKRYQDIPIDKYDKNPPTSGESSFYRKEFTRLFNTEKYDYSNVIPHFWLPDFVNTDEPSARILLV